LIFHFLVPLLPKPWGTIVIVAVIIIIILILLSWIGAFSGSVRIH
jgi:hypothetical protein